MIQTKAGTWEKRYMTALLKTFQFSCWFGRCSLPWNSCLGHSKRGAAAQAQHSCNLWKI